MALDPDVLLAIRRHIGNSTPPSDDDLELLFNNLGGSTDAVAYQVLSERLADMRQKPAEVVYDGDVTERWGKNLTELQKEVDRLAGAVGGPSSISTGQLVRKGLRR